MSNNNNNNNNNDNNMHYGGEVYLENNGTSNGNRKDEDMISKIDSLEEKERLIKQKLASLNLNTDINHPPKYEIPFMGMGGSPIQSSNDVSNITTDNIHHSNNNNNHIKNSNSNSNSNGNGNNTIQHSNGSPTISKSGNMLSQSMGSNSSGGSMSSTEKKARRFSLYVYQHPTDEQKQHISELYGYKGHHDHDDMGYSYAHDSNVESLDETSSSSDASFYKSRQRPRTSSSSSSSLKQQSQQSQQVPPAQHQTSYPSLLEQQQSPSMESLTSASSLDNIKHIPTANISSPTNSPQLDSSTSSSNNYFYGVPTNKDSNNNNNNNHKPPFITQSQPIISMTAPSTIDDVVGPSTPQPAPHKTPVLAFPHTITPYTLPSIETGEMNKVRALEPPDRNHLPQSYLSAVKSSYVDAQASSTTPPYPRVGAGYMADEYDEKAAILKPVQKVLSTAKDWNAEFQTLVNNNKMEGYREISKLAHDFVYTAKIYGKVIISELTLPLHLKTIKPINIGGVAGGHKYISCGILFKLALDSQGLYAGDKNAMKAAGHELKGLMSYYNARVEDLHHPLMALIDYRGYRLVAMSLLPINSETIVYGSSDGGITVHSEDPGFNEKMKQSAQALNLKGHLVGKDSPRLLHSCGDIEGHIGSDGLHYLLDFARVYPPIVKINDNTPPSHLYELIRPELVKSNKNPLSSDALTGWGKFDPNSTEHNYEVKEASYRLFLQVIPKFVYHLDHMDSMEKRELHLTQELHRMGINCRYLGLARRLFTCNSLRKIILGEILARTMRSEIMSLFRGKMKTADTPSEEPFKEVVVHYFNTIFTYEQTPKGKIWPDSIKESIRKKFVGTFQIIPKSREIITFEQIHNKKFDEDMLKKYIRGVDIKEEEEFFVDLVDIQWVMKRFSQLTGVALTKRASSELMKNDGIRLVQSDVKRMKAKVKAHHLVEFAEGMVLWDEAKQEQTREKDTQQCHCPTDVDTSRIAERLMSLADDHFRSALSVSPHSGEVSANWALMLVERARMSRLCSPDMADLHYDAAEDKLRASVCDGGRPKITLDNVLLEYAEFLCINGTHNNIELDMNEANGLRSKVFSRASKKIIEAIKINPSKFPVVLQKSQFIEKGFHTSQSFKESAAYYAGASTVLNCLIQSFEKLPESHHREIAEAITQNLSPFELLMQEKEASESPDLIHRSVYDNVSHKSFVSKKKDENEIQKLLDSDPMSIIRIEMGCAYIRYGYLSHVYGIMCSKRPHTKMASIKLLKKAGSLFQKGIDLDPYNRDIIINHIKKFTSSSQFVEFYQSAIGCPSILDFVEDRLLRIAHMSLKDCSHLPIEFIEGIIEYSPRVKMLVLDGCKQITDSTVELIVRKLLHLETLSLVSCTNKCNISDHSAVALIQQSPKLAIIDFSGCHQIGDATVHAIANNCLLLKELSMNKCRNVTSSAIDKLFRNLHDIRLISLAQSIASASDNTLRLIGKYCPDLQYANFTHNPIISDQGITAMTKFTNSLLELDISYCSSISDVGIAYIAQHCSKLRIFRMANLNNVTSLKPIGRGCQELVELDISGCHKISSDLGCITKGCTKLTNFRLRRCYGLQDVTMLSEDGEIHSMPKLTQLDWSYGNIEFQTIHSITHSCKQLTSLNIAFCKNLTDTSIERIASSLTSLKKLKIDAVVNITDEGIKALSEGAIYSTLEVLSLVGCRKISDVSAHHILRFQNLRKISIGGCLMTTAGANLIASESFELVKIHVRQCLNINPVQLQEKHPHILIDTSQKDTIYYAE
ncbi:Histidine kinase A [Cavenderia fasciculata]|uniref:Histidine kinase A n=1 Tax=Cavenderia fasciculata TaxID=261658 RepID=F4PYX7_CACFS|nr:Histidine kinase A [Cavenderia fasciculata]EGG19006.1 Histidine kinase A [Cavenderia fasciculata]|eukprot:XP_004366639.1 Histidine kinase A [Cavenderia fasciculata]